VSVYETPPYISEHKHNWIYHMILILNNCVVETHCIYVFYFILIINSFHRIHFVVGRSVFCEVGFELFSVCEVIPRFPKVTLPALSHVRYDTTLPAFWHLLHRPIPLFYKFRDHPPPSISLHSCILCVLLHATAKSENIMLLTSIL
jgi:hypothetical protein